ncbi:MAG: hypothetical protein E2598_11185 [Sphingobium sp.]|nr:hypothetical protein [Sphingobium sp.]
MLRGMPAITVGSVGLSADVMDSFKGNMWKGVSSKAWLNEHRFFNAGEFDLVSVRCSLISDPDWVQKIRQSDYDAIRIFSREDMALPGRSESPKKEMG